MHFLRERSRKVERKEGQRYRNEIRRQAVERMNARGNRYVAGESIQLKGRIRTSFVLDAFPCQPQLASEQDNSSSPNNFIALASESDTLPHFFCRLML